MGAIGNLVGRALGSSCPAQGAATHFCRGGLFGLGTKDGMFSSPEKGGIDSAQGFLYVPDKNNHRIEKFNLYTGTFLGAKGELRGSTGTCTTNGFAPIWCTGGLFTFGQGPASFQSPVNVILGPYGALHIIDQGNPQVIRIY